ncbi:MAG: N-glycosylase [Butyrivibrio sp.]|nr:N-glycosylase [Butyrivibrio sp.]
MNKADFQIDYDSAAGSLTVTGVKDFLLSQTLECGQCFHFIKAGEEEYYISAMGKCLHMKQSGDTLTFYGTTPEDYARIWRDYFDLTRDYGEIKEALLAKDDALKPAIDAMWGVRILNQDFFETLISFIISQNQQIPRIKNIVAGISYNYGKPLGNDMYSFPDAKSILAAGVDGIRGCKAGFRSPYIIDACEKYGSGALSRESLMAADYAVCVESLKQIKGVGDKVANCVALFSLGKRNAFPIDVWIKRIMEKLYFGEETPIPVIQALAADKYGEYGGYAQQYLFYFAKTNEIGKNTRKKEKQRENMR